MENGTGKSSKCGNPVCCHCYSVEGAYPESLAYLKKHYGITWNEKKYKVSYEVIAKNIRPEVQVILLDE